jgi:hypothetical protein
MVSVPLKLFSYYIFKNFPGDGKVRFEVGHVLSSKSIAILVPASLRISCRSPSLLLIFETQSALSA